MGRSVNKRELAEILGKSERTLTDWQDDGLPVERGSARGEANTYDTERVIQWLVDRELGKVQSESAKDRLSRVQADRVEIDIKEKMGLLVPVADIEPAWSSMVAAARSQLRAEPDRLAHLLEATEGVDAKRDLIAEVFDGFLLKLSGYEPTEDDEPDRQPDPEGDEALRPAAEDDGRAVGRAIPVSVG